MRYAIIAGLAAVLLASATLLARHPGRGGPDVTFLGRVTDAGTGQPIHGARVTVHPSAARTLTDSAGDYRLSVPRSELGAGRATLDLLHIGHARVSIPVAIAADTVRRDVRMAPEAVALDHAVVTAEHRDATAPTRAMAVAAEQSASYRMPSAPPAAGGHPSPHGRRPLWNTEEYDHRVDNEFVDVALRPLSTFSIDVDRASYSNVRRFLSEGQRPPIDAVRIEEMINYFPYAYPSADGPHPFSVTTETGPAPWRPEHRLVRIGLRSDEIGIDELPPSNLVFLIDVSGSMQGHDRLPLVQRSLRLLVNELRPRDRVAIVVYAGAAGLVLQSTPGSERSAILEAIDRLEAGGSTAGGQGLRLAYDVARRHRIDGGNNRVILATDGDFNVGVSSTSEMVRLIEERREEGTQLTILGFGRGNLNDSMMEQLTGHGNGNYAYIDSLLEARKALVTEMGGTLLTVASDVKLQVEFNPDRVAAYRLIGYENRLLADEDFNDDTKDAGDMGAGHIVTALYEIVPVGTPSGAGGREVDPLRYQTPRRPAPGAAAGTGELAFVKIRYKAPGEATSRLMEHPIVDHSGRASTDFTFVSAVAGFGMLLRESGHAGELTGEQVLRLARAGRGEDREGYRAELIRLVELYLGLERRVGAR